MIAVAREGMEEGGKKEDVSTGFDCECHCSRLTVVLTVEIDCECHCNRLTVALTVKKKMPQQALNVVLVVTRLLIFSAQYKIRIRLLTVSRLLDLYT